jgi:predicted esterase
MGYVEHDTASNAAEYAHSLASTSYVKWNEHTARAIKEAQTAAVLAVQTAEQAAIHLAIMTAEIAVNLVITTAATTERAAENNKIIAASLALYTIQKEKAANADALVESLLPEPSVYPDPVVVPPPNGDDATAVVIMLHGLTGSGSDFRSLPQTIPLKQVKWIFPQAPTKPITVYDGLKARAWYDVNTYEYEKIVEDRLGTQESVAYVTSLIDSVIAEGIPADRIVIGGHSAGGCIALHVALRSKVKLAGCVGLSTYLQLIEEYPAALGPHTNDLPLFIAHGTGDKIIEYQYSVMLVQWLEALALTVDFRTYEDMGHVDFIPEQLHDLAIFLRNTLPPIEPA